MIQICLLICTVLIVAANLHIRSEKILPVAAICVAVCTYSFGIVSNLNIGFYASVIALVIVTVGSFLLKKSIMNKSISEGTAEIKGTFKSELLEYSITPQFIIYLCVLIGIAYFYSGHVVNDWDDLNAWGIYSKNIFLINDLPNGMQNCSIRYKDYQPIQQIMQYFFMKGSNTFIESRLFVTNVGVLYAMCLPVLGELNFRDNSCDKSINKNKLQNVARNAIFIAIYLALPHIFTTQFHNRLGVDYLLSAAFGMAIYYIFIISKEVLVDASDKLKFRGISFENISKIYAYIALAAYMVYLSLAKSSGIVLVIFLILIYWISVVFNKTNIKKVIGATILTIVPIVFYFSWKWFNRRTGNHGYLSDKVDSNMKQGSLIFPSYSKEVILNYLKSIKTVVLTRQEHGMTALIAIAIIAAVILIYRKYIKKRMVISIVMCFIAFCMGHIYMYLFVFDEWEAIPLLEFDRYICQYLGGVFIFAVALVATGALRSKDIIKKSQFEYIVLPLCLLILFIWLFPYASVKKYFDHKNYAKTIDELAGESMIGGQQEYELSRISELNIPMDENNKIMIMADVFSDVTQYFVYYSVPHAYARYANVPAVEVGNLNRFVRGQIEDIGIKYVYVLSNAADSFQGDFDEESRELTCDGVPVTQGWYEVQSDLSMKRLPW